MTLHELCFVLQGQNNLQKQTCFLPDGRAAAAGAASDMPAQLHGCKGLSADRGLSSCWGCVSKGLELSQVGFLFDEVAFMSQRSLWHASARAFAVVGFAASAVILHCLR